MVLIQIQCDMITANCYVDTYTHMHVYIVVAWLAINLVAAITKIPLKSLCLLPLKVAVTPLASYMSICDVNVTAPCT